MSVLKVDRGTCRVRNIPIWEVTFQILSGEADAARTTVQVVGSHSADGGEVVAQAWQVLSRISGVVATAQANFAAAQQAGFESAPPVESQLERLERARLAEMKH